MNGNVRDRKQKWIDHFTSFLNFSLRVVSRRLRKEVAKRDGERGRSGLQWITPAEGVVAEALANLIVPSDDSTPGIEEVCVLGPSTLEELDRLIRNSPERQDVYSQGLLSFDIWALRTHNRAFTALPRADQIEIMRTAERIYEEWVAPASTMKKAWRRFRITARGNGIPFLAARLFPQIRSDCFEVFYTSRVSWIWLEYDGPPMDEGYSQLATRRN